MGSGRGESSSPGLRRGIYACDGALARGMMGDLAQRSCQRSCLSPGPEQGRRPPVSRRLPCKRLPARSGWRFGWSWCPECLGEVLGWDKALSNGGSSATPRAGVGPAFHLTKNTGFNVAVRNSTLKTQAVLQDTGVEFCGRKCYRIAGIFVFGNFEDAIAELSATHLFQGIKCKLGFRLDCHQAVYTNCRQSLSGLLSLPISWLIL